ncbi:MAG: hypothetical protein FWD31_11045 [Planctomycetaceae bacterium]|nr:hypothetical protein [Planctomycetaceae bacterium]
MMTTEVKVIYFPIDERRPAFASHADLRRCRIRPRDSFWQPLHDLPKLLP